MADGLSRDAVFAKLIDELTGQNVAEELVDLREETRSYCTTLRKTIMKQAI